jgi:hypothetical protein
MSEENILTPKLAAKLVLAMKSIDAVAKTGRNETQRYNYVTAADVGDEVRTALCQYGIAFTHSVTNIERWERPTANGGSMMYVLVEADATFTDSESGESFPVHCAGIGSDTGDKGIYKALTGGLKYALRMNFIIPDNADPENDAGEKDEKPKGTQRAQRPAFVPPPKPTGRQAAEAILSTLAPEPGDTGPEDVPLSAYENMDAEPPERPKPNPAPRNSPPIGTKAKVLYAIAMGKGWTTAEYRAWVNNLGYSKDSDIPMARFDELKKQLEE